MKKYILIILFFFLTILPASGQELEKQIDYILSNIPRGTKYGIMIYNPNTKDTLYQRNIFDVIKPASNVKLFTTGVGFNLLGSDYQLSTKLLTDDQDLSDGVINGNLYIKGFGHSLFTDQDIDTLALKLKEMGIREITGAVIGDDSYFDSVYYRDDWIEDEVSSVTLPPVSAIVINRNRVIFNLSRLAKSRFSVQMFPNCRMIKVRSSVRSAGRRNSLRVSQIFDKDTYEFVVSGSVRSRSRSASVSVDIKNPPLFAAYLLHDRLISAGLFIGKNPGTAIIPEKHYEVDKRFILFKNLASIINKRSDNFLAECLFKTVGAVYSNKEGNAFYATQAIMSFLRDNDIYCDGVDIVDGSGLSHYNIVTVCSIVELLDHIYFNNGIFPDYFNSLSIAGIDGTLRNRMAGSLAENNFHGKTGTLNGVITLSGYIKTQTGEDLIVSMLFEYVSGYGNKYRAIQDRILELL